MMPVLSERKQRILALIIESYISTGEPVGSKTLSNAMGNSVSSATIRKHNLKCGQFVVGKAKHIMADKPRLVYEMIDDKASKNFTFIPAPSTNGATKHIDFSK